MRSRSRLQTRLRAIRMLILVLAILSQGCHAATWGGASSYGNTLWPLAIDDLPALDASRIVKERRRSATTVSGTGRVSGGYSYTVSLYRLPGGGTVDADSTIVLRLADGSVGGFTLPARVTTDGPMLIITTASRTQVLQRAEIVSASHQTLERPKQKIGPVRKAIGIALLVVIGVLGVSLIVQSTR